MTLTLFTVNEHEAGSEDIDRFARAFDLLHNGGCHLGTSDPLTDAEIAECEWTVAAYRLAEVLVASEAGPEPDSCTHCGIPEEGHVKRWKSGIGWHAWTAPDYAQRALRRLAGPAVERNQEWVLVGQEFRRILAESERSASRG